MFGMATITLGIGPDSNTLWTACIQCVLTVSHTLTVYDSCRCRPLFTDHFNGPGRAVGQVCVCVCVYVCVRTITFELDDLRLRCMAGWFSLMTLSRSGSSVKVRSQSSRSHEEDIPFWLWMHVSQ